LDGFTKIKTTGSVKPPFFKLIIWDKQEEVRILAILRGLDYADQAKILDSCKKSLKTIAERKDSLKEWANIHKSLTLES